MTDYKSNTMRYQRAATPQTEYEGVPGITPVYQNTAFTFETAEKMEDVFSGRAPGYVYTRISNPTIAAFERRIAELENGRGAVACASGMAAVSAMVLGLAGTGDEVVSGNSIFGGTYSLFKNTLSRYGITTRFVDATDPDAYEAAINERTRLVFAEAVGNPRLDVPDIAAIAAVTRPHGIPLAVDNTIPTPALFNPVRAGADIVIHSTSKFINGHGTAVGGIIVDCGSFNWDNPRYPQLAPFHKRMRELAFLGCLKGQICRDLGCCLSPFNAFLMNMGVETLELRMERHCANALRIAGFLQHNPRVLATHYPGLPNHPDHAVAARQFKAGYGAMLTLRLAGRKECFRFINGLRLARNQANLGDTRTLVVHPASTFCRELTESERAAVGVSDGLVRISAGIENHEIILEDIDRSLASI